MRAIAVLIEILSYDWATSYPTESLSSHSRHREADNLYTDLTHIEALLDSGPLSSISYNPSTITSGYLLTHREELWFVICAA